MIRFLKITNFIKTRKEINKSGAGFRRKKREIHENSLTAITIDCMLLYEFFDFNYKPRMSNK